MPTTSEKLLIQDAQDELVFLETNLSTAGINYSTKKIRAFIDDCYEKHDKYVNSSEKFSDHLMKIKIIYWGVPILLVIFLFFPKIQKIVEFIKGL